MTSPWKRAPRRNTSLRSVELFSDCSRSELERVGSLTTMIEVRPGAVLVTEGRIGREFIVVLHGTATAYRNDRCLTQFGPGSFFGELALLGCGVRTATVIADTEMALLVSSRAEFAALQEQVPRIVNRMSVEVTRRLRNVDKAFEGHSLTAPYLPVAALRPTGA